MIMVKSRCLAQTSGRCAQIVFYRSVDVDHAGDDAPRRFCHINVAEHAAIRRVQRPPKLPMAFCRAQRARLVPSSDRPDVHFRTRSRHLLADTGTTHDFFADEKHRCLVAFAFPITIPARHGHGVHHFAHASTATDRNIFDLPGLSACRRDCRCLVHAKNP